MQIEQKDPATLRAHPAIKHFPRWDKESAEWIAFVEDIREHGIKNPIKITAAGVVIDGETRRQAAKQLAQEQVPTITVPDDEVNAIILRELLLRRNLTKSALAYLSFPVMAPAFEEARKRNLACLALGKNLNGSALRALPSSKRVEDMAESIGIGRRLFFQAAELHEIFAKRPELREQFEPGILAGDSGLGAVIAGIAGKDSTINQPKVTIGQLALFTEALDKVEVRFKYWQKFKPAERDQAVITIRRTVSHMPAELRAEWLKALKAANKEESAQ